MLFHPLWLRVSWHGPYEAVDAIILAVFSPCGLEKAISAKFDAAEDVAAEFFLLYTSKVTFE